MLDKFRASPKILKHTHFAEAHSQKPSFSGWWKDSETSIQVLYVCSVAKSFLHLNIVKVKWTLPGVNVPTTKTCMDTDLSFILAALCMLEQVKSIRSFLLSTQEYVMNHSLAKAIRHIAHSITCITPSKNPSAFRPTCCICCVKE